MEQIPRDVEQYILTEYLFSPDEFCVLNKDYQRVLQVCKSWRDYYKILPCNVFNGLGSPVCGTHQTVFLDCCLSILANVMVDNRLIYVHGISILEGLQCIVFLEKNLGLKLKVLYFCCEGVGICITNETSPTEPLLWDFS